METKQITAARLPMAVAPRAFVHLGWLTVAAALGHDHFHDQRSR